MRTEPLTPDDEELIRVAEGTLDDLYHPERHRCSAAIRTESGGVYAGINLVTRNGQADVHSEPVALAKAVMDGDPAVETSVAVYYPGGPAGPMQVASACGVCRELLWEFAPDMDVLVPTDDGPRKAPLSDLLPAKG